MYYNNVGLPLYLNAFAIESKSKMNTITNIAIIIYVKVNIIHKWTAVYKYSETKNRKSAMRDSKHTRCQN